MKIGVFVRPTAVGSSGMKNYYAQITRRLEPQGVQFVPFHRGRDCPPDVDLCWDPRGGGGARPYAGMRAKPHVVTLIDLLRFSLPLRDWEVQSWRWWTIKRLQALDQGLHWQRVKYRREVPLIAISEFVRQEAIRHLHFPPERIFAIPLAADPEIFWQLPDTDTGAPHPYFLHISNHMPPKNTRRLVEAYLSLPTAGRPKLKMVGWPHGQPTPAPDVEGISEFVDTATLRTLYQQALAFVFPSLHEGFGLPILEAMACGCPVITSDRNACAEVAGEAAVLVNPYDTHVLAAAMQQVMTDHALRTALIDRGRRRAAEFSWEITAQRHLSIFESVIHG